MKTRILKKGISVSFLLLMAAGSAMSGEKGAGSVGTRGDIFDQIGGLPENARKIEPPRIDSGQFNSLVQELRNLVPAPAGSSSSVIDNPEQDAKAYALLDVWFAKRFAEMSEHGARFKSLFLHGSDAYLTANQLNASSGVKARTTGAVAEFYQNQLKAEFRRMIMSLDPRGGSVGNVLVHQATDGAIDGLVNMTPIKYDGWFLVYPKTMVGKADVSLCAQSPERFREEVRTTREDYVSLNVGEKLSADQIRQTLQERCGWHALYIPNSISEIAEGCGSVRCVFELQAIAKELWAAMQSIDRPFKFAHSPAKQMKLFYNPDHSRIREAMGSYIRSSMDNTDQNFFVRTLAGITQPAYWAILAPVDLLSNLRTIKSTFDFDPNVFGRNGYFPRNAHNQDDDKFARTAEIILSRGLR